jgi:uncharacterized protein YsxB (DUF464 family)
MMEVEILRDPEGRIQELRLHGEIPADEPEEGRYVEVGVSMLLKAAVLGLREYLRLTPEVEDDPDRLVLRLKRDSLLNREIDAVLETTLLGLKAIEKRYANYLEIKEVPSGVKV